MVILPPKKPTTPVASLVVWGAITLACSTVFWAGFAKGLKTGEYIGAFYTNLAIAIAATGLLAAVLAEAWCRFRGKK